jgi:hypothetical protein
MLKLHVVTVAITAGALVLPYSSSRPWRRRRVRCPGYARIGSPSSGTPAAPEPDARRRVSVSLGRSRSNRFPSVAPSILVQCFLRSRRARRSAAPIGGRWLADGGKKKQGREQQQTPTAHRHLQTKFRNVLIRTLHVLDNARRVHDPSRFVRIDDGRPGGDSKRRETRQCAECGSIQAIHRRSPSFLTARLDVGVQHQPPWPLRQFRADQLDSFAFGRGNGSPIDPDRYRLSLNSECLGW